MKKIILRFSSLLSSLAILITTYAATKTCYYIFHQPKFPDSGKNLGKH